MVSLTLGCVYIADNSRSQISPVRGVGIPESEGRMSEVRCTKCGKLLETRLPCSCHDIKEARKLSLNTPRTPVKIWAWIDSVGYWSNDNSEKDSVSYLRGDRVKELIMLLHEGCRYGLNTAQYESVMELEKELGLVE